jgi:hypothetical protein
MKTFLHWFFVTDTSRIGDRFSLLDFGVQHHFSDSPYIIILYLSEQCAESYLFSSPS